MKHFETMISNKKIKLGKDVAHIICGAGGGSKIAWDLIARPIFDSVEVLVCDNIEGQLWDQIQSNDN